MVQTATVDSSTNIYIDLNSYAPVQGKISTLQRSQRLMLFQKD